MDYDTIEKERRNCAEHNTLCFNRMVSSIIKEKKYSAKDKEEFVLNEILEDKI